MATVHKESEETTIADLVKKLKQEPPKDEPAPARICAFLLCSNHVEPGTWHCPRHLPKEPTK